MGEFGYAMARATERIAAAHDAMTCDCAIILGAHRKADCGPQWHRQTWHQGGACDCAPVSPFVRRALSRELPAKEYAR